LILRRAGLHTEPPRDATAPAERPIQKVSRLKTVVHPDGLPTPQRYLAMLAVALGITMAVLDSAVANIALPSIAHQLHVAPAEAVWIINAYQLAIVVSLLPLASLGELIGYRRVYISGLAVFTLASLGCALSHSLPALIAARILQGLGAAGVMSVNGAMVRFIYPNAQLGRGIGLNALIVSIAAAVGPSVASAILSVGTWEWLFAVNVPIGVVAVLLGSRVLPYSELGHKRFDYLSGALNAAMFGLFFVGVDTFTHSRGHGGIAAVEIVLALAAGTALIRRELKTALPLIPIDLLRSATFSLSVGTSICSFAAYALAFLALPFYLETVLHKTQVLTGLLMTPWPIAVGLAAPLAGRLSDRVSAAILGGVGLAALAIGLLLLATLPAQASNLDIVWRMALCGAGFGFFQAPNNRILMSAAPRSRAGAAGGMLAVSRLTGMTIGATLAAIVFRLAPASASLVGLSVAAGFALAAAAVSLSRLSKPQTQAALA
jgi:DHA2 family multidrug resistance protein-like MFS transporter